MDKIYSSKKIESLKEKSIYYNHIQQLKITTEEDLKHIPQIYRYFSKENKPYGAQAYYNAFLFDFLNILEGKKENITISTAINSISKKMSEEVRKEIEHYNIMEPLLKKAKATYQIDLDRNKGDKVTQSLLHIYSSYYENTESLFILKWIVQSMQNKKPEINLTEYKNKFGGINKTKLITNIIKDANGLKDFQNIIREAYDKNLRHLCFHNDVELDDEKRQVIGISNPNIQISYAKTFKIFYAMQQLQNYLRLYSSNIMTDEKDIVNEGFFGGVTFVQEEKNELCLLQLYPFYANDSENDKRLSEVSVREVGNFYTFSFGKDIISLEKNAALESWYGKKEDTHVSISSAHLDVYKEGAVGFVYKTRDYGDFVLGQSYKASLIFL